MKNMDSTLLFCFITANKEFIEHNKSIEEIDKIVIYKRVLLSELRHKVNLLLSEKKLNFC
jgi:hypothetical protein